MKFLKVSYLVECPDGAEKLFDSLTSPENRVASFVLGDKKYKSSVITTVFSDGVVDVEICNDSYFLAEKYKLLKDYCAKALADKLDIFVAVGEATKATLEISKLEAQIGYLQRHCLELKSKIRKNESKPDTVKKRPSKDLMTACSRLLQNQTKSEREMTIQEIIHIVKKELKNVGE